MLVSPSIMVETATPESNNWVIFTRPRTREIIYTKMIVTAEPIKALKASEYWPRKEKAPNSIPRVAKAEAPDDTPKIKGSQIISDKSLHSDSTHCKWSPHDHTGKPVGGRSQNNILFKPFPCNSYVVTNAEDLTRKIFTTLSGDTVTGPRPVAIIIVIIAAFKY